MVNYQTDFEDSSKYRVHPPLTVAAIDVSIENEQTKLERWDSPVSLHTTTNTYMSLTKVAESQVSPFRNIPIM